MNRKQLRELYTVEYKIDPKTGKDKKVARYVGPRYTIDLAARNRIRPALIAEAVLLTANFLLAGFLNNAGSRCFYVLPFYVFTILPIFYFALAVTRVSRMKETIDELDRRDGLESAKNSAMGLTVLGILWSVADLVFLLLGGASHALGREISFLLCGVVCALLGFAGRLGVDKVAVKEKT